MALRFRRSIKLCNGVRMNFTKNGIGLGLGINGARTSFHSSGAKSTSFGIPGTGLFFYQTKKSGQRTQSNVNKTVTFKDGTTETFTPEDVYGYDRYIEKITRLFVDCSPSIDWMELKELKAPFTEGEIGPEQIKAIENYNALKPTLLEKLVREKFEQRKANAEEEITNARQRDLKALETWKTTVECANKIVNGEIDGYYDAINASDPFVELSSLGSDFEFGTDNSDLMEVEFCTKLDDVIPNDKLQFTPTGKVSLKKMTKTEMYNITQDYVCSMAIRLAREVFAIVPVSTAIVHADEIIKDAFGNDTRQTILSVKFERQLFNKTNFNYIDASDFVETFEHNEKFLKTQGFKAVDRIK